MSIKEPEDELGEQFSKQVSDDDSSEDTSRVMIESARTFLYVALILVGAWVIYQIGKALAPSLQAIPGVIYFILVWIVIPIVSTVAIIKCARIVLKSDSLSKEQIIHRWQPQLIEGKDSDIEGICKETEDLISFSQLKNVRIERREVSPGLLQTIQGVKRSFLVVYNTENKALIPYQMYVCFKQYGIALQVSWYLARRPTILQRVLFYLAYIPFIGLITVPIHLVGRYGMGRGEVGALGLDIFAEQDLCAYVAITHECLLQAIDNYGKDHNVDTSKINRNTKGFLGIS
jgi:hypothetical protein